MPTANEYRHHAQECLRLACAAVDFYAKDAMIALATDFQRMAESQEQRAIKADDAY